jgi:hypothetical protein
MTLPVNTVVGDIIQIGTNELISLSWNEPSPNILTSKAFGSQYNLRLFRKGEQTGTNQSELYSLNPVNPFIFKQEPLSSNGIWLNNNYGGDSPTESPSSSFYKYYYPLMSSNGQYQVAIQYDVSNSSFPIFCNVFQSSDYGQNWIFSTILTNSGIPGNDIGTYAAMNSSGNIIYYTTGASFNNIQKSINYGNTFTSIPFPESSSYASIACDGTGNNVVWVAGTLQKYIVSNFYSPTYAYFSNDGATTWNVSSYLNSIAGKQQWTNATMSNNGSVILLASTQSNQSYASIYICTNFSFSSINSGTWTSTQLGTLITSLTISGNGQYALCGYYDGNNFTVNLARSVFPFTSWTNVLTASTQGYYSFKISYSGQYQYGLFRGVQQSGGTSNLIYSSDYGLTWTTNYTDYAPSNFWIANIAISSSNAYYLNAWNYRPVSGMTPAQAAPYNSVNGYSPGIDISFNPTTPGGNNMQVYIDPSGNVWYTNPPISSQLPIQDNVFTEGGYFALIQSSKTVNTGVNYYLLSSIAACYLNNIENPTLETIASSVPFYYFLNTPTFGSVNPSIPGPYGQNMSYDWFVQYNNVTQPQLIVPDISYISQTTIEAALPGIPPSSGNIDLFCETTFDLSAGNIFYSDPSLITYFVDPSLNSVYFYGFDTLEISSNIVQLVDSSYNDSSANQIYDFQAFFYGDDTNRTIGCRWIDPCANQLTNSITGSPYNLRLYKRQIGIESSEIAQWFPNGEVPPFIYQNDISMGFPIQSNWLSTTPNHIMAFFFDSIGDISYNSIISSTNFPFNANDSGGYILVVQRNYKDSSGNSYYTTVGCYLNYISPALQIFPTGPTIIQVNTNSPYRSTYYNTGLNNMSFQWSLNQSSTGFNLNVGTNSEYFDFSNNQVEYNGLGQAYYQCAVTYQFNYPPYDQYNIPFYEITPVNKLYGNPILTSLSEPWDINLCFKRTEFPPPPWSRFSLSCGTDGQGFTAEQLQMRRKAEVLQYYTNKVNMQKSTKAQQWSYIARGLSTLKQTYATQTVNYTNPNTTGYPNNNRAIILPDKCINQALRLSTFPSYCSDVPGPVVPLTFDPKVPLVRYKRIYTYPTVNQPATSNQVNSA